MMTLLASLLWLAMGAPPTPVPGASPGAAPPDTGPFGTSSFLIPVGLTLVILYFFMMRPQQQKDSEKKKMLEGIKRGDWIRSIAGFYGRVVDVEKKILTVEVANNVKIKMVRDSVAALEKPEEVAEASK